MYSLAVSRSLDLTYFVVSSCLSFFFFRDLKYLHPIINIMTSFLILSLTMSRCNVLRSFLKPSGRSVVAEFTSGKLMIGIIMAVAIVEGHTLWCFDLYDLEKNPLHPVHNTGNSSAILDFLFRDISVDPSCMFCLLWTRIASFLNRSIVASTSFLPIFKRGTTLG